MLALTVSAGALLALVQVRSEPGLSTGEAVFPSDVVLPGQSQPAAGSSVDDALQASRSSVLARTLESDEGGRFFRDESEFELRLIDDAGDVGEDFQWITLSELRCLLERFQHVLASSCAASRRCCSHCCEQRSPDVRRARRWLPAAPTPTHEAQAAAGAALGRLRGNARRRRGCTRIGIRPSTGLLHRVAAAHKFMRRLLWPLLIRKTPFERVVRIATDAATIASLTSVTAVIAPWSVVIREAARPRLRRSNLRLRARATWILKGAFVASFRDAYVHTTSGLVCTADGELVADSAKKIERHVDAAIGVDLSATPRLAGSWATVMYKFRPTTTTTGSTTACCASMSSIAFPTVRPLTILVPPTLRPFQLQSLRYCLPAQAGIESVADGWVQVEQLVLPSFITEPLVGMVPPDSLAYIRNCIVTGVCGELEPPVRRRLYISRAGTGHRQILNEGELNQSLRECEFEIVRPEGFSFDQQVSLFRSAELIVGARGAALTNMVFTERAKSWSSPPMFPSPAPCISVWPTRSGTSITICSVNGAAWPTWSIRWPFDVRFTHCSRREKPSRRGQRRDPRQAAGG